MAEITAKLVNDLRARTGQGMMECKKMLTEAEGLAMRPGPKPKINGEMQASKEWRARSPDCSAADGKPTSVNESKSPG